MLFGYGMKLGVKLLAHGRAKRGLRYLIVPVNYWRTVEFDLVYRSGASYEYSFRSALLNACCNLGSLRWGDIFRV